MKYCQHCGKEINDDAVICIHCGRSVSNTTNKVTSANPDDAPNTGIAVLGFFIPIVGLILYFVWKANYPLKAKSAGKGALISFIVSIALSIIFSVIAAIIGVVIGTM